MRRGLGGTAFEPVETPRDRELTLGPMTLGILGIGLLALCSVCFIFGYAVGHRSTPMLVSNPASTGPSAAQILANQPKPAASENVAAQSGGTATVPVDGTAATGATEGALPAATLPAAATPAPAATLRTEATLPSTSGGQTTAPASVIQTALPKQPGTTPIANSNGLVHPALPQAGAWMVQVAAVSQQEDANVLLSALRKRGYAVSVRHDPADGLMHVQVGPFASHDAAAAMRQRLLNDGYNALIQP